jgi:uncharacterized repeat protein (TIGR02059 family)
VSKFYNNKKLVLFILVLVVMLGAFSVFKIITLNTPQEATVYNKAKIYGPSTGMETITGDAEIDAAGAQLQNMTFAGNLTITKSVGDGDVTLKNVTVEGNVYVKGGGANSIHLIDCTISVIYVEHNGVRVVAEGSTTVQQVNLFSSGTLAEEGITGAGFINFTIPQDAPAGITASLAGDFNSITIKADQTHLSVLSGTIVRMLIAQGADGAVIDLSNSVAINTLNINSKIQVTGTGRIDSANSTVDGSSFETAPIALTPPVTEPDTETGNGSGTSTGTSTATSTGTSTGTGTGTSTGTETGTGTGTGDGGGVAPLTFLNLALSPAGSLTATPSSPTFIMTFDRGLTDYWTTNKDCFKIYKDGTAINVLDSSDVTMIDKNNIQLSPSGLIAGASYNIVVSASLQANNGNTLGTALTKSFTVAPASAPNFVSSEVTTSGDVSITFDKSMESTTDLSGKYTEFTVKVNGTTATLTGIQRSTDTTKIKLIMETKAKIGDVLTIQYTQGTVKAEEGGVLENFGPSSVTNTLSVAAPIVSSAITGRNNDRVTISFDKAMADPSGQQSAFTVTVGGSPVVVSSVALNADTTKIDLILSTPITTNGTVTFAYTKGSVTSSDGGILKTFAAQNATNQYGSAPNFVSAEVTSKGDVSITFDKNMESSVNLSGKHTQFIVTLNGATVTTSKIELTTESTKVKLTLNTKAAFGDVLTVQYTKGTVKAEDGGVLDNFGPSSVNNALPAPAPNFVSAEVTSKGDVSITFDKNMESTIDLSEKNTQFVVILNGSSVTTTFIERTTTTTKIKLTLQTKAIKGDVITVQYIKGTVKAEDGGVLESFGPTAVTNAL